MAKKQPLNIKGVALFLVGSIMLISFGFYGFQIVYTPNILVDGESRVFIIPENATFKDVQDRLYEGRYVNDLVSFSFLAKLMKYSDHIKPGKYTLEPDMTNMEAVRLLRSGEQTPVNITFNNVRLIKDLGERITRGLEISADEFNAALADYLSSHDTYTGETLISMFIPNTYQVYYTISPRELIKRMELEYDKFWDQERKAKAEALGMSELEVSTLASIVQAETVKREEKKRIAGLYINRLKQGIPLQADPTLVYASGDFEIKRVLNVHKQIESPYNTYKYKGLPPGPINMPSIESIDAVLNYEHHDFIFMCAKEDFSGYHNFARTNAEHEVNARKYQRALNLEMQKARQNR